MKDTFKRAVTAVALAAILSLGIAPSMTRTYASSHREAPMIAKDQFADNTDVYAFRSYESGRSGFVTLVSNFIPFQLPSAGPIFYPFDDTVLYRINIDNTGDGREDIIYEFQFTTEIVNPGTILGHNAANQDGIIRNLTDPDYNMPQTYTVRRILGTGNRQGTVIAAGLRTPPNAVGPRVTPNYEANLGQPAVYPLPGGGRVFAGQRDESFFIDVGGTFDAFALRSLGATGGVDNLRTLNINTIAMEVPIQELTRSGAVPSGPTSPDAVIGVWSTAHRRSTRVLTPSGNRNDTGTLVQVSRLGNPLVNEVVIPLGLKDAFNSLDPTNDAIAVPYVLNPELPQLIQFILANYGAFDGNRININIPPPPRNDLAQIFALGIPAGAISPTFTTVIQGTDGPHEYLRLNVAIPPSGTPSRLGLLGGDVAGFPNGRRPFDDVVDIALRAMLGGTPFTPATNVPPNNSVGDGVAANFEGFLNRFPYLQTPNLGNTPRPTDFPANQTFPSAAAAGDSLPIIVDEDGKQVKGDGSGKLR